MQQPPPDRPQQVMAAPNQSRIVAVVEKVERSAQWPDKWQLVIKIVSSERTRGPNFAKPGERVQAFAFGSEPPAQVSDKIRAEAEYIGDARSGQFKLTDVDRTK